VYRFLTGEEPSDFDFEAKAQFNAGADGRPDIKISFKGSESNDIYVEVKVSRDCPITRPQASTEGPGYSRLGRVVFLIPPGWRHIEKIQHHSHRSWTEFARRLSLDRRLMEDVIFHEYSRLLSSQFPSIQIHESEIQMFENADRKGSIALALKLHRIVDELAEARFRVGAAKLGVKAESTNSEYGFEIRVFDRPVVWVGIWSDEELFLGAAFREKWHPGKSFDGFRAAQSAEGWSVLDLNDLVGPNRDVVHEATVRIQQVLEDMLAG
jgi:hypothetical protein